MAAWLIADIAIYTFMFAFLIFAVIYPEFKELSCPNGINQENQEMCGEGKGKWYDGSEYESGDDIKTSMEKIKIASNSMTNYVHWRYAFIISFFIALSVYGCVICRLPRAHEFVLFFFVTFIYMYFSINFYKHHYYQYPQKNIIDNVNNIAEQLKKEPIKSH